jgi:hypothetical protein
MTLKDLRSGSDEGHENWWYRLQLEIGLTQLQSAGRHCKAQVDDAARLTAVGRYPAEGEVDLGGDRARNEKRPLSDRSPLRGF